MSLRWVALLAPLSGGGCDLAFGLDRDITAVTGTYLVRSTENDASGRPVVVERPLPLTAITAEARLDDGTPSPVTLWNDGSFSFVTRAPGQNYALTFRTPNATLTYQLAVANLDLVERLAGRDDRVDVAPGTRLAISLADRPTAAAIVTEEIDTTGLWTRTAVQSGPIDLDWTRAGSLSGSTGLLADDAVHYVAYAIVTAGPAMYYAISHAATEPHVSTTPGQTTTVSATAVPVATDRCVHLIAEGRAESDRLLAATPGAYAGFDVGWELVASPDDDFAAHVGFPLAYETSFGAPSANSDAMIQFGNPFPGHQTLVTMEISATRFPNPELRFPSESRLFDRVPGTCAAVAALRSGTVALAGQIAISGTLLATDEQPVDIDRSNDLPVTWTPTPGGADHWIVSIFEIVANKFLVARASIVTTTTTAMINPDLLLPNVKYMLEVRAILGIPQAANGDFRTRAMPGGTTEVPTTIFTVR